MSLCVILYCGQCVSQILIKLPVISHLMCMQKGFCRFEYRGDYSAVFCVRTLTITFREGKPVASETNESLFHKRFMCFQYLSKYLFQSSKCSPPHRKFPLFKGTGFLKTFSCRERNNNFISELIKNENIGLCSLDWTPSPHSV